MNILVTICARAGSKGVVSKNTRDFLGYPICLYALSALDIFVDRYGSGYGDFCLAVNSDSPKLYQQIDAVNFEYIKTERKESLAGDVASKIDVIRDTLAQAESIAGRAFDIVVDLDLTSPLRRAVDIKNVIDTLDGTPGAEVALSVTGARRNPYFNQLIKKESGFYGTVVDSDFVARQQAPEIFDVNAAAYAYRADFLRNSDTMIIKAKIAVSYMEDTAVLDIDNEHDYEMLQVIADYYYKNKPEFGEIRERILDSGQ